MSRRSTRLMRLENSLYNYNLKKECWDVKEVIAKSQTDNTNLFEIGSYFTCKHMSQKVNPLSFRIGQNRSWYSAWFSQYKYFGIDTGKFQIDLYIRNYLYSIFKELKIIVDKIYIKEIDNKYLVKLFIYEEGLVKKKETLIDIKRLNRYKNYFKDSEKNLSVNNPFFKNKNKDSKKGSFINTKEVIKLIENQLKKQFNKDIFISIVYKKDIGDSASLLGNFLCRELEKPNMNFKRALRESLNKIKSKSNIRGLRVNCSGRLGRAPMAKMEWFRYGSIPLTKISAKIDYIQLTGKTKYGSFGIKLWLYKHKD
jgi:ribosomal protein S3